MRLLPSLLLAAVAAPLVGSVAAQAPAVPAASPPPFIAVIGRGEAKVVPDRAMVMVGVQSRAATAAAAATENATRQRAIIDALRALGLTSEQISTANYSVQPELQYDERGQRPRVLGYVVSNTVRAEVRRIEQVGAVLDAVLAKGANDVSGLSFFVSDPGPVRRAAITHAVTTARADAEALATAAGGRLGEILEMSTTPIMVQPVFARGMMAKGGAADMAMQTPVEPGQETVEAMVSVRFRFVPGR